MAHIILQLGFFLALVLLSAGQDCQESSQDFRVKYNGSTFFSVAQNGTCSCFSYFGNGSALSALDQNPYVSSIALRATAGEQRDVVLNQTVQSLQAQVAALQQTVINLAANMSSCGCGLGSLCNPAVSCLAIKTAYPWAPDGTYWLDTDGPPLQPFQAFCDMTTDGGGWTLLITLARTTVTNNAPFDLWTNWPTTFYTTGGEPFTTGMFKGSLAPFTEIREQIASGAMAAYSRNRTPTELALIRTLYGWATRGSTNYNVVPPCRLSYAGQSDNIAGCSPYTGTGTTTVLGYMQDPTGVLHTWFARGNCCSTAGGSSLPGGDANGSKWGKVWFR